MEPWGLDRIDQRSGLDGDYDPPNAGENVHVFILDTGIRISHTDFGGRALRGADFIRSGSPECAEGDTSCAADGHGHGTHCAGTAAGLSYGVAKAATLHAVKVLSDGGSGSSSGIISAIEWVVSKDQLRPAVISMSLGGSGAPSQDWITAINDAVDAGVPVTVAAGNSNGDACNFSPAGVPSAITVGSTANTDARSHFSNYGSCIDIFAPGSAITSATSTSDTATATWSGTSMACPHVAGAAALLLADDPSASAETVLSRLQLRSTKNAFQTLPHTNCRTTCS